MFTTRKVRVNGRPLGQLYSIQIVVTVLLQCYETFTLESRLWKWRPPGTLSLRIQNIKLFTKFGELKSSLSLCVS